MSKLEVCWRKRIYFHVAILNLRRGISVVVRLSTYLFCIHLGPAFGKGSAACTESNALCRGSSPCLPEFIMTESNQQ